jgi:threonine/homoserine/homoserine lactone efflux protein
MAASTIAAFWGIALLLIIVPGPDWAFVLSSGLTSRSVLPAVGGLVLGYSAITVVVAAGVGAIVARSPGLLTGLIITGGLYLMWHGIRTFARPAALPRRAGPASSAPVGPSRVSPSSVNTEHGTLARGMGVSALNPKGLLLFLALLPQFTSPNASWPVPAQLAALGLVFMLSCGAFYLCLGSFARNVLFARPATAHLIIRLSGIAMAVVGAVLLAERLIA